MVTAGVLAQMGAGAMKMTLDDLRAAIDAGHISHSRVGDRLFRGSTLVYARHPESPTGVHLWATF